MKSYKIIESKTNNVESKGWKTIVEIEIWTWKIVRQRKEKKVILEETEQNEIIAGQKKDFYSDNA